MKKLRVAWICAVSNEKIRSHLSLKTDFITSFLCRIKGNDVKSGMDVAIWNSNAIEEFEKFEDIEIHIICPVRHLSENYNEFTLDNIHYHFFREQHSSFIKFTFHQLFTKYKCKFKQNRKNISSLIHRINPDLIHVMGAENPYYSLSLLDVPATIPTILQLQALLCRLENVTKVPKEKRSFHYKGIIENKLINKATFIGTCVNVFREYITKNIKPDAKFLDLTLHMAQKINTNLNEPKKFDFVYFSVDISKAGEDALEAFILAHKKRPNITLNFIGGYSAEFKKQLDLRIIEAGIEYSVFFQGKLPTHDEVIKQIMKSRFALLPLKMDIVPNTIHEALSNGLPVITTVTDGTPLLNLKRNTVLLSNQNDYEGMAANMILLIDNKTLANTLRNNGYKYEQEKESNSTISEEWRRTYKNIISV